MSNPRKLLAMFAGAVLPLAALTLITPAADATPAGDAVVISEVYGAEATRAPSTRLTSSSCTTRPALP